MQCRVSEGLPANLNSATGRPRPFLDRLNPGHRSSAANSFLAVVRSGETDPDVIIAIVTAEARARVNRCLGSDGDRYRGLITALRNYPDDARAEAEYALRWESLTPAEKAREKARRSVEGINAWMESQDPSDKQLDLLSKLGHDGDPPASKAEASRLIDGLLKRPRPKPPTPFSEEVRRRANIGGYGGRN